MQVTKEKFLLFLALLGVCLTVTIPLLYPVEDPTTGRLIVTIIGSVVLSAAASVALMLAGGSGLWIYRKRRRPLAWLAIRVLNAAARGSDVSVGALDILSRNGSLAVSLPRRQNDFVEEDDSFLAFRVRDGKQLGIVSVILVQEDSYICVVTDRMNAQDFWNGLESRMTADFSPPSGVGFSQRIDRVDVDFAQRLISSWGG